MEQKETVSEPIYTFESTSECGLALALPLKRHCDYHLA